MDEESREVESDIKKFEEQVKTIRKDISECSIRIDGAFKLNNKINRLMTKFKEENAKKNKIISEYRAQVRTLEKQARESMNQGIEVNKLKGTITRLLEEKRRRQTKGRFKKRAMDNSALKFIEEETPNDSKAVVRQSDFVSISQINPKNTLPKKSPKKALKPLKSSSSARNIYIAPEKSFLKARNGSLDKKKLDKPRDPLFPVSFMAPVNEERSKSPEIKTDLSIIGSNEKYSNKSFYSNFYEENTQIENLLKDINTSKGEERQQGRMNFKKKEPSVFVQDSFEQIERNVQMGSPGVKPASPRNMLVDIR